MKCGVLEDWFGQPALERGIANVRSPARLQLFRRGEETASFLHSWPNYSRNLKVFRMGFEFQSYKCLEGMKVHLAFS